MSSPGDNDDVFNEESGTPNNEDYEMEPTAFSEVNTEFFDVDDPETIRKFLISLSTDDDEESFHLAELGSLASSAQDAVEADAASFEVLNPAPVYTLEPDDNNNDDAAEETEQREETHDNSTEKCNNDENDDLLANSGMDDLDILLTRLANEAKELSYVLKGMADDLDKQNFNVNVSKIAGNAATIAGTGVAIAGGVLGFFTFGASLPLVLAGSALAASGGITSLTSFVVDQVISRKRLKEAEAMYRAFIHHVEPLAKRAPPIGPDDVVKPARDSVNIGNVAFTAFRLVKNSQGAVAAGGAAAEAGTATAATAFNTLGVVGRVAHVGGLAVNTVLLPLSIYDLVKASVAVHKKTGSPAGCVIRELVATLEEIADLEGLSLKLGSHPDESPSTQEGEDHLATKEDVPPCKKDEDTFTSSDAENEENGTPPPDEDSDFEHVEVEEEDVDHKKQD